MTPTSEDIAAWERLGEQKKRNAEQARALAKTMGPWLRKLARWKREMKHSRNQLCQQH